MRARVPTSNGWHWRALSRQTLAYVALCVLILLAATADLIHTESHLPDVTPTCQPDTPTCRNAKLSEQLARDRAAEPLQDQYDSRAWLYASAILAVVAVATAWALRVRPRSAWPQVFTNLGVTGVWLGIAAIVLLLATDGSSLAPPPAPTLLLPTALVAAAAVGTLIGRSEGWAEQAENGVREMVMQAGKQAIQIGTAGQAKRSRLERLAGWLTLAALVLTGVTCMLALVSLLGKPDCGGNGGMPGWTDPLGALSAVTAVAGMVAGVGALLLKRWVAALISLVACPVALLVVLDSTCAFY